MGTNIRLTNATDGKPRRLIEVDEFGLTVSTGSGAAEITLPGGRTYNTGSDYIVVHANGVKIFSGEEYTKSSSTTITAATCAMFPDGKFQQDCKLDFELYTTN